jgi:protein-disulfide isomerase
MTCPHCADFHVETFPEFRDRYVETGKVRFILREVYFDPYGLWASMLARCAGEEGFYPMVDAILKKQDEWSRAEDPAAALQKIGRVHGLGSEAMRACLTDQDYAEALVADYQANADEDGIRSTPSFVIGGELHSGNMGIEELSELIDAAM